jgi:hypothetical protein
LSPAAHPPAIVSTITLRAGFGWEIYMLLRQRAFGYVGALLHESSNR